jgi:hypothetical protein
MGTKFSELPALDAVDGTEQAAVNDSGTSKRVTTQQLKAFSISEVQAAIEALQNAVAPTATGNQLVSGGGVAWVGDFDFIVSAATYLIQGDSFSSAQDSITLSAADGTDPRIDVIAVDDSGAVVVLEGTPAATPAKPDVDPLTQLELTFVYVPAAATEPEVTITADIYHENAEWTTSRSGTTIELASATAPHDGSVSLNGTAVTTGNWVQFAAPAPLDLGESESLIFWVLSKATWPASRSMSLQWRSGNNTPRGSVVTFKHGSFGFDSAVTGAYQQIVIPLSLFGAAGLSVDRLRATCAGSGSTIGFYMDDFVLQGGLNTTPALANDRLRDRGPWLATTAYVQNDLVTHQRMVAVALAPHTNSAPTASNPNWRLLVDFSDVALTGQANEFTGQQFSTTVALGLTLSGSVAIDASEGNVFDGVQTGNMTLANPTNPTDGATFLLRLVIGGAGGWTIAFGSDLHFPAGEPEWPQDPDDVVLIAGTYLASNATWECAAVAPGGAMPALSDLSDVAIVSPDPTDVLTWDGSAWVAAPAPTGTGDVVGPAASVDGEVALFDSTTGKLIKRATGNGYPKLTSGVQAVQTAAQLAADLQATGLTATEVGFRNIPQRSSSANTTTVAADSGKHLLHPAADGNTRTFTIDSNANVAYPVGTAITFVNETSQVLSIAITADDLVLAGSATTGTRSLAQNGVATAIKVTSTKWIISGTGLT